MSGDGRLEGDYWRRLVDLRRLGWREGCWRCCRLAIALSAAVLQVLTGGGWPDFAPLRDLVAAPMSLVPTLLFVLLFGPLPEEMGWRGYALDLLQAAHGPLAAALLLGAVHGAWHLPLFFIEGSFQHALGAFTPAFWRFMASIVALSVIMAFAFNLTARSTLVAVLLHWTENLSGALADLSGPSEWYRLGLYLLVAAAITGATRGRLASPSGSHSSFIQHR